MQDLRVRTCSDSVTLPTGAGSGAAADRAVSVLAGATTAIGGA